VQDPILPTDLVEAAPDHAALVEHRVPLLRDVAGPVAEVFFAHHVLDRVSSADPLSVFVVGSCDHDDVVEMRQVFAQGFREEIRVID